jgi:hypothetical protein
MKHMAGMMVAGMLLAALLAGMPTALADNGCTGVMNQGNCRPAPWNGQLMRTWDTPGYYGGWTDSPVACDPFTLRCRGWAQP